MHPLGHMTVHIQREARRGVAQVGLHGLHVVAVFDRDDGVAVPEVMESLFRHTDLTDDLFEMLVYGEIENDANICNWVIYFKDQEKWKLVKYKSYNKENKENPQLKKEWSEDDEYYYGIIQYILNNECVGKTDRECAINWFKHFKDIIQLQNRVKPSERQISALEWQLKNTYEGSWQYIETKKLFEQLKRLMEK